MTSKIDLTMDLFSKKEDKAVNEIEKVNAGMTLIRETIRNTGDEIVESNSLRVAQILNDCISHFQKYKSYLNGMNGMQQSLFYGRSVDVWNGERVSPLVWEQYFQNVVHALNNQIKSL